MPQTKDVVDQFRSLPRDRQSALLGKMSPEQKQKLNTAIQARLKSGQAKPATAAPVSTPEESTWTKIGRGAAIGAAEGLGVKPSASRKEAVMGTIKNYEQAIPNLVSKTWEANKSQGQYGPLARAAATAADLIPTLFFQTVHTASEGSKEGVKALQNKDWETAAEKFAQTATMLATLKEAKEAEIEPEVLSRSATQKTIQKIVHDRALKVQDHIQAVHDSVKAEDAAKWNTLEKTIDTNEPQGAIDLGKIGEKTRGAVAEKIKYPQKLPKEVSEAEKFTGGDQPIEHEGLPLDPTNPHHAGLIKELREAGVDIPSGNASFAKVRQFRSKLGDTLSRSTTLSGESRAVGKKLYGDTSNEMRDAATRNGMPGQFDDANAFHKQYREDFVDKDALLGKSLEGKNAHEVMNHFSDPKYAEQARRIMDKYRTHGMNPEMVGNEAKIFDKLGSGLPKQFDFNRWELMGYAAAAKLGSPWAGPMYTASREALNLIYRDRALRLVKSKNQALATAADKLGPKASIKEIMAEADKSAQQ